MARLSTLISLRLDRQVATMVTFLQARWKLSKSAVVRRALRSCYQTEEIVERMERAAQGRKWK